MSNKEGFSKRDAQRLASNLRRNDDWNPQRVLENRESALDSYKSDERSRKTAVGYDETSSCSACELERAESGDETALCEHHFSEMMAF